MTVKAKKKESATCRARIFPSTYKRYRVRAALGGITLAEVADDVEKKATLWEKSQKHK